ncbi:MAG: phosphate ABC transporter ATP-binding protein [Sulfolobales archaeon]|nr:phosphate ABC transporter ATP-binding protein [Sulfolobales archaeon]MCX8198933.1 phosphate ABC transporter ATP-binding protein [Sulfolobales archaeon]MDW8169911.1 phosphate ABC transporter ATP-binding protein [Desulfurococcaceae archaeon]
MSAYAIEVSNLRVRVRGLDVLRGVDLKVRRNTILVIMGPSGSGKSTLLRTLNRLTDFIDGINVEGSVVVLGRDVFTIDPCELRRKVVLVSQEPNPFPHMTIFDNVALPAKLNGIARNKQELYEVVKWALEKVMLWDEVKNRLRDYPHSLSGGQRQRLCLARALAAKPEILLLDEPTANIDPSNTFKIEESLRELREELTIVMVTHMPHQAVRVADHVALLYDGIIVEEGPAKEVFMNPKNDITNKFLRGAI